MNYINAHYLMNMRKALAFTLALFVLFTASSNVFAAGRINSIVVQGNQRIENETIRAHLYINRGDYYSAEAVDESLKSLFATGLFEDVRIDKRGASLIVIVKENPIINKINFEGNSEIKDKDLSKEVQLKPRMIFTKSRVQEDVKRIVTLYLRSGHFGALVEPKIIRLRQNRVNLVFDINEGATTKIRRINFVGNKAFSDSQLRSVVATSESRWWKFLSNADNFDPDRLEYDKELLRRHYLKNGYADFKIISATAELDPNGKNFFINISVDEGDKYSFGNVNVDPGSANISANKLLAVIKTRKGQTYDASLVDKSVEQIAIEAGKLGFAFAKVTPDVTPNPGKRTTDLTYRLDEGSRIYIERIDIVGNERTLDHVIRREISLVEGDAYNRILVDRARRRITALDFFSKVDIKEHRGSADDKVVLVIRVEEKSTGTVNLSTGIGSFEGVFGGIGISERNLLGRGQYVMLNTNISKKSQQVNFSFTEPYFLGNDVSFGIDAFSSRRDLQKESSYDLIRHGGGIRFGFPLSENSRLLTRYNFSYNKVSDVDSNAARAIRETEGTTYKSMIGYSYVYDTLDNPLHPTSGFRFSFEQDLAGLGGDVFYLRTDAKFNYFYNIYGGAVLMLRGTGGYIKGYNDKKVPIIDRFYKGGSTFRGFKPSGLGPREDGDAIGARAYAIGTTEVTFPFYFIPEEFGLRGAVFSDFGTVFSAPEDGIKDSKKLRASVGVGVAWDSPFGPMRVDFSKVLKKEKFDKDTWFNFGIGVSF